MSWQTYVDEQLLATGCVKHGAIIGHDGSIWATSSGFTITPAEGKALVGVFADPSSAHRSGVLLNATKYFALRVDEFSFLGKQKSCGVCVLKSNKAIVIGTYDENIQAGACNKICGKLCDYLKSVDY